MTAPAKRKGNTGERELVRLINSWAGWSAERSWGSDGRAFGEAESVDLKIRELCAGEFRVQVKRLKRWAASLHVPGGADVTMVRGDRENWHVIMPITLFRKLCENDGD